MGMNSNNLMGRLFSDSPPISHLVKKKTARNVGDRVNGILFPISLMAKTNKIWDASWAIPNQSLSSPILMRFSSSGGDSLNYTRRLEFTQDKWRLTSIKQTRRFDEILESMRVHYFYFGVQTRVVRCSRCCNKTNLTLDPAGFINRYWFHRGQFNDRVAFPTHGPIALPSQPDPYPFRRNE